MTHFLLIVSSVTLAWICRCIWHPAQTSWNQRWRLTLSAYVLPPALILITAIAVVWMGPQGAMSRSWLGSISYGLSLLLLIYAGGLCLKLTWDGWKTLAKVRSYPDLDTILPHQSGRVLKTSSYFAAQVGFWQPVLLISEGLLTSLDPCHLEAILAHEQAHFYYRDTYLFFWLGWLRLLTSWLPQTQALWEELLVLREIRADRRATQTIDPLTLAESLVLVVNHQVISEQMLVQSMSCTAPVSLDMQGTTLPPSRLEERVNALLTESDPFNDLPHWWINWWPILLPLVIIPFHR